MGHSAVSLEDMLERRDFVTSAIAMAGAALSVGDGLAMASSAREFYQLRKYAMQTGPQLALAQNYFEHALIPALNRMGMAPVGAFKLDIGPETPTYYLLIPSNSVDALVTLDLRLAEDAEFMKAGAAFWGAPASAPAFVRVESWLMSAFAGWPKIVAPKGEKRIFQLRTYESASYAGHVRKSRCSMKLKLDFCPDRIDSRVFRRHVDRVADAELDLHADIRRRGGPECEVERVCE